MILEVAVLNIRPGQSRAFERAFAQAQLIISANLPAALFVVISGTLYTVMHYLNQPRPFLKRDEVIDALSDMIAAYVQSARAPRHKARRPR